MSLEKIKEIVLVDNGSVDWHKFKDIRLEALMNDPQAFGASYDFEAQKNNESWKEALKDTKRVYTFIEHAEQYIGMAGAKEITDDTWMVIGVYLKKEFRGQGMRKK